MQETLGALASRAEPPAAGVASALAAAAAAALVELTAGLAADRLESEGDGAPSVARLRELGGRAAELRDRLLAAADEDTRAYARALAATDDAARARALSQASEPPLEIAECAAEVAEAAEETARAGSWAFTADAVVAAELAAAAALGCSKLVAIDLAAEGSDPRVARAGEAAERARRASDSAGDRPSG